MPSTPYPQYWEQLSLRLIDLGLLSPLRCTLLRKQTHLDNNSHLHSLHKNTKHSGKIHLAPVLSLPMMPPWAPR